MSFFLPESDNGEYTFILPYTPYYTDGTAFNATKNFFKKLTYRAPSGSKTISLPETDNKASVARVKAGYEIEIIKDSYTCTILLGTNAVSKGTWKYPENMSFYATFIVFGKATS